MAILRTCPNMTLAVERDVKPQLCLYVWVIFKTSKPSHLLTDGFQWWTTSESCSQIAFCHLNDVGWWSHGWQILSTLAQCWANMAIGCMISRFCQGWANVGPQSLANQNSGCRGWANSGPMVDFYSRWRPAIIGDFWTLCKKSFIMVCLKIIFQ